MSPDLKERAPRRACPTKLRLGAKRSLKSKEGKNINNFQEVNMNKVALMVLICLTVSASIFAEIKFQAPVKIVTIGFAPNIDYLAQSPVSDTVYSDGGIFNVKTGASYNMVGVSAIDWDDLHNIWCCPESSLSALKTLMVKTVAGQQTSYSSADGKGFGVIHSIKFSDGMIVVGCDSGLSITTPVNGVPGAWTNLPAAPINEVVAAHGQVWAISSVTNGTVYHYSGGVLTAYGDVAPTVGDFYFFPLHGDVDKDGNFWLSYTHANSTNENMWETGLGKFDGKDWIGYFITLINPVKALEDTIGFGTIRVDKNNDLWFVNDDFYGYSVGKIHLDDMSLERINYVAVMNPATGQNYPAPLSWTPLTVTITPSGEALFGGTGCFVRVDYGSSVIWHPTIAKVPSVYQKNLSGYIFDPLGRRIASLNSFSKKFLAGNYFVWPANNQKAEKLSVVK